MKLKVINREVKYTETEVELPAYFYFQGETFEEEYIKITEKYTITIKYDYDGYTISKTTNNKGLVEHHWLYRITDGEEFENKLKYLTENLQDK